MGFDKIESTLNFLIKPMVETHQIGINEDILGKETAIYFVDDWVLFLLYSANMSHYNVNI